MTKKINKNSINNKITLTQISIELIFWRKVRIEQETGWIEGSTYWKEVGLSVTDVLTQTYGVKRVVSRLENLYSG